MHIFSKAGTSKYFMITLPLSFKKNSIILEISNYNHLLCDTIIIPLLDPATD